jgi:HlyD family secretion protein
MESDERVTKLIEIRSEEVQEIVSQVPGSLIRWGITVIFVIMLALLGVSWFIKYPDLLTAPIVITTTPAPVNLVARTSGRIQLLKQDQASCQAGEVIGVIQSNANLQAVLQLEKQITSNLPIFLTGYVGELQPYLSASTQAQVNLTVFTETASFDKQIEQLTKQLATHKKLNKALLAQQQLAKQELQLALQKFKTDSILFEQKVTAALDFNASKTTWLQQQRNVRNLKTGLINNELQVDQLYQQVTNLQLQKAEQEQKLTLSVTNARQELLSQLAKWKETYLLTAPMAGHVAYLGFLENDLNVEAGKPVFSVIPDEGKLIARAELPVQGSGRVKAGQQVNIRLANYPFEQFGLLRGTVQSVSEIPNEAKYFINIELPPTLVTSQKRTIPFKQQLSGTTEIITEDLRLLERFFYQFKKLIQAR